jgi:hypothetical protein
VAFDACGEAFKACGRAGSRRSKPKAAQDEDAGISKEQQQTLRAASHDAAVCLLSFQTEREIS